MTERLHDGQNNVDTNGNVRSMADYRHDDIDTQGEDFEAAMREHDQQLQNPNQGDLDATVSERHAVAIDHDDERLDAYKGDVDFADDGTNDIFQLPNDKAARQHMQAGADFKNQQNLEAARKFVDNALHEQGLSDPDRAQRLAIERARSEKPQR